jgi:hypothetical protein
MREIRWRISGGSSKEVRMDEETEAAPEPSPQVTGEEPRFDAIIPRNRVHRTIFFIGLAGLVILIAVIIRVKVYW